MDAIQAYKVAHHADNLIAGKNRLFAYFDRRRVMVQPENVQRHRLVCKLQE
jgi:hypothetical protein